ncbi:MAG: DUF5667 domain-containing protein [Parcubacteria group bacterium]
MNEFKKGIKDIKQIGLTLDEKERILANLNVHINEKSLIVNKEKIVSPWTNFLFSRASYAIVAVLVLGISSVNIFSGAANSLPGDKLYSLKVDFIEPLQYTLAVGDVSRAQLQSENLNQRLLEVEKLESEGRLTNESQVIVGDLIKKHTDSFNTIVSKETNTNAIVVEDTKVDFEAKINAHTRILEILENNSKSESSKENINKIKKVIAKEPVQVASAMFATTEAEDVSSSTKTPEPATFMVMKASKVNTKEDVVIMDVNSENVVVSSSTPTQNDVFEIKKKTTEKMIENLKKVINKTNNSKNTRKDILEYSKEALHEAEQHLINAEENEKNGNRGEALIDLTNSRRSAKEADTSFEASVKIKED